MVAAFEGQVVGHPMLETATSDVRSFIANPVARPIGLLVGPTGVGKSTLLKHVIAGIEGDRAEELAAFPHRRAVLKTDVPSGQKVSLKSLYATLLDEMGAPLPGRQIDPEVNRADLRHRPHTMTEAGGRIAVLSEIEYRRPTAIVFDEADHFTRGRGKGQLLVLADVFKDLTLQTKLPLLLSGTYVLMDFRGLTAQFDRRVRDLHLRPYRFNLKVERLQFGWAVHQLAGRLPVPQPELAEDMDMIYERTMGCVGHVFDWFVLALIEALRAGSVRIEPKHLVAARLPLGTMESVRKDLLEGAKKFAEEREDLEKHRRLLGMPPVKAKPFTRNPKRDLVGRA